MATAIRPCFARPVEFISIGTDFVCGATNCTVQSGVYANVISLFRAFCLAAGDWVDNARMTDDVELEFNAGETGTIELENDTLRSIFGFANSSLVVTDGQWMTADYHPEYVWFPERQKADQGVFRKSPKDQFAGEKSLTGNLSGISTGSTKYYRTIRFVNELSTRLGTEMAENSFEAARVIDKFFQDSISAAPTVHTHPSLKGFWYYDDINDFIADCTLVGTEWADAGGISFNRSFSPDTYVFCHFDPLGISVWEDSPAFPVSRLRYTVELSFTTAYPGVYL